MTRLDGLLSLDLLNKILESTPDGIFVIDRDRRVVFFNEACGKLTGRVPTEVIDQGCSCNEVIHCHTVDGQSLAYSLCPAKAVFRGEESHQREEMLLTNSAGEERWIETTYSPLLSGTGEVEYVVGIMRDVHERKQLEEKLHQSEKLASFGQLVAGISHELRNPLGIIRTSLDVIENPQSSASQRLDAQDFIRFEVTRLTEKLNAFLAFARPQEAKLRPTPLGGLVTRQIEAMRNLFTGVDLQIEASGPDPIAMVDPDLLRDVITNLVMNAGDALDGKGRIRVTVRQQANHAVIEVEDSGPGIPEDQRSRIFDPFFTTKDGGTGLGLSICYQIMLLHKGSISVGGSELGGACFAIRVPCGARLNSD